MKTISIYTFSFLCLALFAGCKKDEPETVIPSSADVALHFKHVAGTETIQPGVLQYVSPAGETYSVNVLKYYVGHPTLIGANGHEHELSDHDLIDIADPSSLNISAEGIPNGTYHTLRFNVGIEEEHNHSGDQEGDLDPIYGMIWTWNTGYIFFKHEGSFIDSSEDNQALIYHYGTDDAFVTVDIPVNVEVKGEAIDMDVVFDLNALYGNPHVIAFEGNNAHQSTSASDVLWIQQLRDNFETAFSATVNP